MEAVKIKIAEAIEQRDRIEADILGLSHAVQDRLQLFIQLSTVNAAILEMMKCL